jgi:lipoic acid synthetase
MTTAGQHQRGAAKTAKIPIKVPENQTILPKPQWIRMKIPHNAGQISHTKAQLRQHHTHTVCEEASCPNLGECFARGTATFIIMGDICTRRCPFCDVAHGRPLPLDANEPQQLAQAVKSMGLRYVVITSVDRDDLRDGGAAHFVACLDAVRQQTPQVKCEILVPDFRGRQARALGILQATPPDVFNHNVETVPRLYAAIRPAADYQASLALLQAFKQQQPALPTKSGLMLGLGETLAEVEQVLRDLRQHGCEHLTLGQYLQPSRHHLAVQRYVTPAEFLQLAQTAKAMGFSRVASGPMVRSSYHAEQQNAGERVC